MSDEFHPVTPLDLYRVAIETRNLEIGLFWQRSNYFLALNTAIAAGFFTAKVQWHSILLAGAGFGVAFLWFRVNLGGKFWQSRWEQALSNMERALHPGINLFSAPWEQIESDVRQSLERGRHGRVRKAFDKLILRKPSVTFAAILLSLIFQLFWAMAIIITVVSGAA